MHVRSHQSDTSSRPLVLSSPSRPAHAQAGCLTIGYRTHGWSVHRLSTPPTRPRRSGQMALGSHED